MALLFCCPVCGSNLRVPRSAAVVTVACPGCREPIHVPRHTHPAESLHDTPAVPAIEAARARAGLARLTLSLWLFLVCIALAILALSLRAAVGPQPPEYIFVWVPLSVLTTACWGVGLMACWFRLRGYLQVRGAAAAVGVEMWVRLPAFGAVFTAIGETSAITSVIPWLVGRTVFELPPEIAALAFFGILCGLIGLVLEFAFVTAIHRLLWETAGWQAANKTGSYAMTFLVSSVAAMLTVIAGGAAVIALVGGLPATPPAETDIASATLPIEVRIVRAFVLGGLTAITALVAYRYGRLLRSTRRALAAPQPYAGPIPTLLG